MTRLRATHKIAGIVAALLAGCRPRPAASAGAHHITEGRVSKRSLLMFAALLAACPQAAFAHPHVFVEANVEIARDDSGEVTGIRHVWRFDELFSSTVLLDYDVNGDGDLDISELEEVSKTVTSSLGEYDYYTEVRLDKRSKDFKLDDKIMVDYVDGQVLMFFQLDMNKPLPISGHSFRVAVSDPTYFVAIELAGESAIQIGGPGAPDCKTNIEVPDFDELYARSSQTLTEQFFNNPNNASLGDEWLTWVTVQCP